MSTQPGVTSRPWASTVRLAGSSANEPTPVIRPRSTVTSAIRAGAPVPSTTVPPRMTRSCMLGSPLDGCPVMLARTPRGAQWPALSEPLPRRYGVRDLGLGHHLVTPGRVQRHLGHAQPLAQLEQGGLGHHVDQVRLAQEVDM